MDLGRINLIILAKNKAKQGDILTCQDDLIEFREAMENLKKKKGRNERQSETTKLKSNIELIRS
jgi:hypothetical protein